MMMMMLLEALYLSCTITDGSSMFVLMTRLRRLRVETLDMATEIPTQLQSCKKAPTIEKERGLYNFTHLK